MYLRLGLRESAGAKVLRQAGGVAAKARTDRGVWRVIDSFCRASEANRGCVRMAEWVPLPESGTHRIPDKSGDKQNRPLSPRG